MRGIDSFLFDDLFDEFLVRVERDSARSNADQRDLASRALSQLRFDIASGAPRAIEAAQRLLAAVPSDRGSQPRVPAASLADQTFVRSLLEQLQDEALLDRLVVEMLSVTTLTDRQPLVSPRLPPLPRPPPEPNTLSFEVRFVDEIGQAVSGIGAEFSADGPATVPTNAAGVALLDNVKTSSASVAIADADALSKVLDPRWQRARSGKPPSESNVQEVLFEGSPLGPFALKGVVRNTVVIKPPLGKLFATLFDKSGRVRHAKQTFQIKGPQAFEGTTDETGGLLIEDVFPGDYTLSLALEFFEENDPDRAIDIVESPLVVLAADTGRPEVREIGAAPFSVLAELYMFFNTNKTFLLPTALPSVKKLRKLYADNAPCELLVVGHADTRGDTAYNDQLSLERAESIVAYLKDDVDAWLKFYGTAIATQKRWGKVEDHLMLTALSDFVDKPKGEDEVRWFQRTRKLTVDGKAGSDTRQTLIKEYMALDGASLSELAGEINATAHGCGENFPLDDSGETLDQAPAQEKRDAIDRRVELFFFDAEFGITPPPPGPNSKPGSIQYPLWRKRVAQIVKLSPSDADGPKVTFVELADAHFRSDSAVVLPEGQAPDQTGQHQAITSVGLIATVLRLNEEQPGRSLLIAGHTDTTAGDAHNDELSRDRANVALALLEGDRQTFTSLAQSRSKPADINQILAWVSKAFTGLSFNSDPGKITDVVNTFAVRGFQKDFNTNKTALGSTAQDLKVDGAVGELTWGALFDCFEFALQQELGEDAQRLADLRGKLQFVDDERKSLGYGERFPLEELGVDNFRSQSNRRVEILFFNAGEAPDLAHDEDDPETSEVYLPGHFARLAVPPRTTARVTGISLLVGSFQAFVIDQAPFTIETDTGAKITGFTDARGAISARVPADSRQFSLTVQDPRPIPTFQALFEGNYRIAALAPATSPLGAIQRLRRIGIWDGPELALFSPGTLDALSYFQLLAGLPRSGQLDDATAAALEKVTTDVGAAG